MRQAVTNTPNTGRRRMTQRTREEIAAYLFILPWIIGFTIFHAGTILATFVIGLFETDLLSPPKFVGLQNYITLFTTDTRFMKALQVTTLYTLGSVPLQILLALGLAILLNQNVAGLGIWRTLFYVPSVMSGVAIALIWQWFYHPDLGLFNTMLAEIGIKGPRWLYSQQWALPSIIAMNVWSVGPLMLIFLAGLKGISREYYEAAAIDGANSWQQFVGITIPLLSPQILFNTVISIIGSYQIFSSSFVMTQGGPNNATLTLVLHMYTNGFLKARFGYAAAIASVLFVIILILTVIVLRFSSSFVHYEGRQT